MLKKILTLTALLFSLSSFAGVDINKASAAELDGIKGIGPSLSGKILKERNKGNFKDWPDLMQRVSGMGGVRCIRFLEPMTASILSNGRVHPAFGAAGGQPGAPGVNQVRRVDGSIEVLGHIGQVEMAPGDVFEIHTPGGGAYGAPEA